MFGRHILVLLLLLSTGVISARAQQSTHSDSLFRIDGNVQDISDQHGMENIRVDLRQRDGSQVTSTLTRSNGAFEFSGIANGEYFLEVNAVGYEPFQQSLEIKDAGRQSVSLLLARATMLLNSNIGGAVISAHELSVPRKAQDEFDKGLSLLYGKSDYRGAIAQFQHAIKDFPAFYEAYAMEGASYQDLGEISAAEEALRKSVELSSEKYPEALYLLSALLLNSERYDEAARLARKCVEQDTSSWQGPFELARALFGLKQFDDAEKNAIQARERNPDNPALYILLANIHIERKDLPALALDLDTYLKIAPSGPDADWVHQTQVRLQSAIKHKGTGAPNADSQRKPSSDGQDSDDAIAPDSDEPDSPDLPPLPPPTPNNP